MRPVANDGEPLVTIRVPGLASTVTFVETDQEGGFWELFAANKWEPETISLIVRRMEPGRFFVDVGAWIGPLSLIAAKCGARVVAFEPDPVALRFLRLNLDLNPDVKERVMVVPKALSTRQARRSLSSTRLGNSMASLARDGADSTLVDTIDAKAWSKTSDFVSADMVKIDVEGAEFSIVPRLSRALRDHRPLLLLSVHSYHLRERFHHRRGHRLASRVTSVIGRARLFLATRSYSHRWQWDGEVSEWRLLTLRQSVRFLVSLQEAELVLSDELIDF